MKICRIVSAVLALVCILGALPVAAESQPPMIAAFEFDNEGAVVEANLKDMGYGSKNDGYNATSGSGKLFASVNGTDLRKIEWSKDDYSGVRMQPVMSGGNNNPWGAGAYLQVQVSTLGYEEITFSAQLGGTKKGPRDFKLQYSLDGTTFIDLGVTYAIVENKTMEQAFADVALPADAANKETVYIRMTVASEALIGGGEGLAGTTSGETAVNNIYVSGKEMPAQADIPVWVWIAAGGAVAAIVAGVVVVLIVRKKK